MAAPKLHRRQQPATRSHFPLEDTAPAFRGLPDFNATRMGRGFAGSLLCQAPCEGHRPFASSPFAHSISQSRRRASGDLFSASLELPRQSAYVLMTQEEEEGFRARKASRCRIPVLMQPQGQSANSGIHANSSQAWVVDSACLAVMMRS